MEAKRELNNPYGSKLDSANLLILGMEGLRPDGLVPVSQAAVEDAGTEKDAFERQKYGVAHTCIVLYVIVVELVVKHIWEQQQGKTAEHRQFDGEVRKGAGRNPNPAPVWRPEHMPVGTLRPCSVISYLKFFMVFLFQCKGTARVLQEPVG